MDKEREAGGAHEWKAIYSRTHVVHPYDTRLALVRTLDRIPRTANHINRS